MILQVLLKWVVQTSIVCPTKAKIQEVGKKKQYNLCKPLGQGMHLLKTKRNAQQTLATSF